MTAEAQGARLPVRAAHTVAVNLSFAYNINHNKAG